MSKFKIRNEDLAKVMDLLYGLDLEGIESIHRTRLFNLLNEKIAKVQEEFDKLLKEHCGLDESYEIKNEDNLDNMLIDKKKFLKDRDALYDEEFIIGGDNMQPVFKTLKSVILNSTKKWAGVEAEAYFILYEFFEGVKDN